MATQSTARATEVLRACALEYGLRAPTRHSQHVSATQSRLHTVLHACHSAPERARVLRMLWKKRHMIRQDTERSRTAQILSHVRMGGWGKRALDRNIACLMSLRTETATVGSGQNIGRRGHEHWHAVYGLPAKFREADAALGRQLTAEQWDQVEDHRWVTAEEVQIAKWGCKTGRAPGPDGLVVEVWQHALPRLIEPWRPVSTSDWRMCTGLHRTWTSAAK